MQRRVGGGHAVYATANRIHGVTRGLGWERVHYARTWTTLQDWVIGRGREGWEHNVLSLRCGRKMRRVPVGNTIATEAGDTIVDTRMY